MRKFSSFDGRGTRQRIHPKKNDDAEVIRRDLQQYVFVRATGMQMRDLREMRRNDRKFR